MWRSVLKVAAAGAAWAAVHSLLASRPVKRWAARRLGERNRNGLYRPFYVAQSLATAGALILYVRPLPDRTLYRASGPLALGLRAGQLAAILAALWAAREVGIAELSGARPLLEWSQGRLPRPEAEAQGPSLNAAACLAVHGPFRWSRHPLNALLAAVCWLQPHMTAKWVAWSIVATVYVVVGSKHEEARLLAAYGEEYAAYQESGCPFLLPGAPTPPLADAGRLTGSSPGTHRTEGEQ